jgi:Nif-specific regulatory protein
MPLRQNYATPNLANPREKLIDAMDKSGWVQAKAARLLGLTSRQLSYALKKHRIEIKKF